MKKDSMINNVVILTESIEALIGAFARLSEESECLTLRVSWTKTKMKRMHNTKWVLILFILLVLLSSFTWDQLKSISGLNAAYLAM